MKMKFIKVIMAFAAATAFTMPAVGQDAKTLDELLMMIEDSSISETADYRQREAAFKSDQRKQAQLLKKAQNDKAFEERRSDRLEQNIRDNDALIITLREQRDKRLGSLKELFGHLTGAAGDIRANLNQSIVSAQIPGRTDFLDDLIDKMILQLLLKGQDTVMAAVEEKRSIWTQTDNKVQLLNTEEELLMPSSLKKSRSFIGMFGICCVTHPESIRGKSVLDDKVGIYQIHNPMSAMTIRKNIDNINANSMIKLWESYNEEGI